MRTIEVSEVTKLVRQLCIDANYYLPADLRQAFVDGQNAEESPLGKTIFGEMIANCDLARENNVPVCQDTGMAIVFAEIGQDVHLTGGSFEDAVTEGVRRVRSISTTPIRCTPRWSSRFSIRSTHPVSARRDSAVRLPLLRARLSRLARISPVCRAWLIFPATLPVTQRASCKQP